eukprot:206387-Lingulodinium_polyedra.AAC.1
MASQQRALPSTGCALAGGLPGSGPASPEAAVPPRRVRVSCRGGRLAAVRVAGAEGRAAGAW